MRKRHRLIQALRSTGLALALMAFVGACTGPTAPPLPDDDDAEDPGGGTNPQGMLKNYGVILV